MAQPEVWRDEDFSSAADLFDEVWGWELDGSPEEKRAVSELYVGSIMASSNRVRVVRAANGLQAFLAADFPAGGVYQGSPVPSVYLAAMPFLEKEIARTETGRESLEFNRRIEAAVEVLKEKLAEARISWQAELKLLITSPKLQGKGLGRLLVEDAFEEMRALGVKRVMLYTDSHCNWQWYVRSGWTIGATHVWRQGDEDITSYAFVKDV